MRGANYVKRATVTGGERRVREPGGAAGSSPWVPHPRTGIYYPKGQEWVMEDVTGGAATLRQTYWLRNLEGVDRPLPSD